MKNGADCSVEVNSVVVEESLVLNRYLSLLHILGYVVKIDPYSVFGRIEGFIFLVFTLLVLNVDKACLVNGFSFKVNARGFGSNLSYVYRKGYRDNRSRENEYHKNCKKRSAERFKASFRSVFMREIVFSLFCKFTDICFTHRNSPY